MKYRVPANMKQDFDDFLALTNVTNAVCQFTLLANWYAQYKTGYTPTTIRGEIYDDKAHSRYTNTDNNRNFRASESSGIKKGDMLIDPDNTVYVLDWEIGKQVNNAPSRALRCNAELSIHRFQEDEVDDMGYLIEEGGDKTICETMPCNVYRFEGRPEDNAMSQSAGYIPNSITVVTIQYNEQTQNIRIGDKFTWGITTYRILDVDLTGLNRAGTSGVLKLQAKNDSGGIGT